MKIEELKYNNKLSELKPKCCYRCDETNHLKLADWSKNTVAYQYWNEDTYICRDCDFQSKVGGVVRDYKECEKMKNK